MYSITRINFCKGKYSKTKQSSLPPFNFNSSLQTRFLQIKKENKTELEDCSFVKFDLQRAQEESERCLLCVDAPCSKACPAGTMPDKFIRQLRFLNTKGAAETILDNNALGGICGTVCPVESLCEGSCLRSKIDHPIQIGKLQRFLHDFGIEEKIDLPPVPSLSDLSMKNRKKVGIVGSGPAGLSAARELARRGALVTIFESSDRPGGILLYGISPMRLDDRLINEEIKRIEEMGVVIKTNVTIKAEEISSLLFDFDALFLSPGLQQGNSLLSSSHLLSDQNEKVEGVTTALEFLRSANIDKKSEEGFASKLVKNKNVVVIGGGSVAMDAANTSLWLGAKRAYSLSLEDLKKLPASAEEINLARQNGVIFRPETRLSKLNSKNGKLVSIDIVEVSSSPSSSPSSSGKVQLNYSDREGSEGRILADTLIFAIGQSFDEEGSSLLHFVNHPINDQNNNKIEEKKGEKKKERWIVVDKSNYQTQIKKIYAGGDAIRGGDCVVNAVQDGKLFAKSFLPNIELKERKELYPSLETSFCGVKFPNPFTLSSSPVSNTAEMCARAFEAGFGGVYYKTLNFDNKFHVDHPSPRLGSVDYAHQKVAIGIQNLEQISDRPLKDNLKDITWLRKNYPDKVVGVSIMGFSEEDWFLLAQMAEEAGAQIIELNFSCPQMARSDAGHHVGQSFDLIERYTRAAKKGSSAPIVAKMTPNLTKIEPACIAAKQGGADAISAINTIRSISHINLQNFTGIPTVEGKSSISGFSGPMARPIALRFIAEIAKSKEIQLPISGMGGIFTWKDAAEFLLLGASNLQLTTAVMRFGYRVVEDLIDGLQKYLISVGAKSVHDIVGKALPTLVDPAQLSLKTEVYSVINPEKCVGCAQCVATCNDAAAQAIHMEKRADESPFAVVNQTRCIGCTMCANVCPVDHCVTFNTRDRITHPL